MINFRFNLTSENENDHQISRVHNVEIKRVHERHQPLFNEHIVSIKTIEEQKPTTLHLEIQVTDLIIKLKDLRDTMKFQYSGYSIPTSLAPSKNKDMIVLLVQSIKRTLSFIV